MSDRLEKLDNALIPERIRILVKLENDASGPGYRSTANNPSRWPARFQRSLGASKKESIRELGLPEKTSAPGRSPLGDAAWGFSGRRRTHHGGLCVLVSEAYPTRIHLSRIIASASCAAASGEA